MNEVNWTSPEVAAALIAATALAVTWIVGAMWQAVLRHEERQQAEWARLQELAHVLHQGVANGHWAQVLAVRELRTLRKRHTDVQWLARSAKTFWLASGNQELKDELDDLLRVKPSVLPLVGVGLVAVVAVIAAFLIGRVM